MDTLCTLNLTYLENLYAFEKNMKEPIHTTKNF